MKNYPSCLYLGWLSVDINNGTERATAEMWKATMQGGEVGQQAERCLYCHPDQRGPLTGPARNALWAPVVLHPPYPEPVFLSQACRKSAWLSSESLVQWSSRASCLLMLMLQVQTLDQACMSACLLHWASLLLSPHCWWAPTTYTFSAWVFLSFAALILFLSE